MIYTVYSTFMSEKVKCLQQPHLVAIFAYALRFMDNLKRKKTDFIYNKKL